MCARSQTYSYHNVLIRFDKKCLQSEAGFCVLCRKYIQTHAQAEVNPDRNDQDHEFKCQNMFWQHKITISNALAFPDLTPLTSLDLPLKTENVHGIRKRHYWGPCLRGQEGLSLSFVLFLRYLSRRAVKRYYYLNNFQRFCKFIS